MNMQVTAAGNGFSQAELTQERFSPQVKSAEVKIAEKGAESAAIVRNEPSPDIIAELERITVAFNKKLKFEMNHQSNMITVKVIDPETDKVIKELPPEELQRLHSHLKETIGVLFDERI